MSATMECGSLAAALLSATLGGRLLWLCRRRSRSIRAPRGPFLLATAPVAREVATEGGGRQSGSKPAALHMRAASRTKSHPAPLGDRSETIAPYAAAPAWPAAGTTPS